MNIRSRYAPAVLLIFTCSLLSAQNTPPPSATVSTPGVPATEATVSNKAGGYYWGRLGDGSNAYLFITDSGNFWLVVNGQSASDKTGLEVIHGTGTENDPTGGLVEFTANSSVWISPAGTPSEVDLSAAVSPHIGMDGTIFMNGAAPMKFTAIFDELYDKPYSIDTVAGRYTGIIRAGNVAEQISIDIDNSGRLNGGSSNCSVTGQAHQSFPGLNPYATAIRFTGPQCVLGNDTTLAGVMAVEVNPSQADEVFASFVGSSENATRHAFIKLAKGTLGRTPPSTTAGPTFGGARRE